MRSVTLGADHVRLSGIKKVLLKKGLGGSVGGKDVCVCICVCVYMCVCARRTQHWYTGTVQT